MTKAKSPESPHFPDGVLTGAVADLQAHPQNYNRHGEDQVSDLMASLRRFGQRKPVVTWRATILAGHGLVEAARRLGWPAVWIAPAPETWTEAEALAYLAADNELARAGDPDRDALAILVAGLGDVDAELARLAAGGEDALRELLAGMAPEPQADPGAQVDKAEELQAKWQTASGQMWQLGAHRLICGDCTDAATVAKVMGGERAALVSIDPPYGIGYNRHIPNPKHDDLANDEAPQPKRLLSQVPDADAWYVWSRWDVLAEWIEEIPLSIRNVIVWDKQTNGMGDLQTTYAPSWEACIFASKPGHQLRGGRERDVWSAPRPDNDDHLTPKPIDLVARCVEKSTDVGAIVFDGFLGSGTTLIACERLGRKCRAVEIAPAYVAVALDRWATMTGKTPVLVS